MALPLKEKAKAYFMRKRAPSILQSSSIKSGMNGLYDLSKLEAGADTSSKRSKKSRFAQQSKNLLYEVLGSIPSQLFEVQVVLRPLALAIIPFLWTYYKVSTSDDWIWSLDTLSLRTAFNLLIILSLSTVFLILAWLAKDYFSSGFTVESLQNFRAKLMHNRAFSEVCKQIVALLTDERLNKYAKSLSSVIQAIGYKSKPNSREGFDEGVQRFSNGDMYRGEYFKGKLSGSGVYTFHLSGKYEGNWVDGEFDGHGVETWDAGSRYRGQYKCGLRDGFGVYKFYNGDEYSGEWVNGHSHGSGVQRCGDGSRYIGEFKSGAKHGFGYYYFSNGDTYAGEYFEDKLQGSGVYRFSEGHLYEGAWHDGKKQGLGIYTLKNGEAHAGLWESDALKLPSFANASTSSPSTVSQTKLLNTVQV
ncbi:hypothetical protein O6H91_23G004500 [Diphasiastrum complanatum]|uniref:Uncharacterized protein n=1 Tax=Diphasiastrum complanatum TaxID=34168 RepID=A0ACC2A848_DIPCM|nr:hypothetical protein O6H91_23G004500 [Diphasiastrum complanatum]